MRGLGRIGTALIAAVFVVSACVAEPGASPDPSATVSASPEASASSGPVTLPASPPPCPTPLPLDPATGAMVTSVAALTALGDAAATCYGTANLEVTAYVPFLTGLGGVIAYAYEPAWLYGAYDFAILASGRGVDMLGLTTRIPPALGSCAATQDSDDCVLYPYLQEWVTVVGHFDDPASATCTATPLAGFDPVPEPIPATESVAMCRTQFVLDSFAPFTAAGPLPPVDAGLCPVEPITIGQLVEGTSSVGLEYGLGCLGAKEIAFDAYVVPGIGLLSGMEQMTVEPGWLADPLNTGVVLAESAAAADAGPVFVASVAPDIPAGVVDSACAGSAVDPSTCPFAPYVGGYVTITGHYDDPESLTCHEVVGPDGPVADQAALVLDCREQFVVDSLQAATGPEPTPTPPVTSTQAR